MTKEITPVAPESLPKYISVGIPKQNIDTLEELRGYVDEMIEHKNRPVTESDIPDDAEVIEENDDEGKGPTYTRTNTCGDKTCHCYDSEEEEHGPYRYRPYRDENGEVRHEYLGKV